MPEYAIEVKNLTKRFGRFVAVDNVSFNVEKGEIFGFLGANGAGKSTTIRMLCGLLTSTSGSASVAGYDIDQQPEKVKENIGYMSQRFSLYEDLTVEENINFFGGVYGLSNGEIRERMEWVLEMAGLLGREKSLTRRLAGGWKQRLALGCAVLHQPRIVFLDEPTGGVDPISRRSFWELINALSEAGTTVLATTHYLDEAEYCHKILLIDAGSLIAQGSPHELKTAHIQNRVLEVDCDNVIQAMEYLLKEKWVLETSVFGTHLHLVVEDEELGKQRVKQLLTDNNIKVRRVERILPSLEDVFIHLIEDKSRELGQP